MSSNKAFKQNLYFHLKPGPAECGLTPVIYHDVRRFQYFFLQNINVAKNRYIDRNMDENCCTNDKCKTHCNQMTLCLLYFQFSGVDQRDSPPFWGVERYKQPIRNLTIDAMFYYYILNDIENN